MFFLEGNIGAGKSTFLSLLAHWQPSLQVYREPVDRWDGAGAASLLGRFMESPTRWGLTLETYTMMCRLQEAASLQASDTGRLIVERSVFSGYYIFAKNSYEQGFLNNLEWALCRDIFNRCVEQQMLAPQGFIYLQVSPRTAYRRVKQRARAAESTMSMAYLEQLHQQHERFLCDRSNCKELCSVPVLKITYDEDFDVFGPQGERIAQKVADFVCSVA
ncbi:TPA: hypothetical protein DCW54_01210 [Candidatus Dependentiae bacterium]|nr:hypothetical protein [Candidatus Dependentiae bacterium]